MKELEILFTLALIKINRVYSNTCMEDYRKKFIQILQMISSIKVQ